MNLHIYFKEDNLKEKSFRQSCITLCSEFDINKNMNICYDRSYPFINVTLKEDVNYNDLFDLCHFYIKPYKCVLVK